MYDIVDRLRAASDSEVLHVILQSTEELKRRARPPFWDLLDGVIRIYGSPDDKWCMFKDKGRFVCEMQTENCSLTGYGDTPVEAAVVVCSQYRVAKDLGTTEVSNR